MNIIGVIPARYASTRFPGKPLAKIAGKPMIQHVVEQCKKAQQLSKVIVATDDDRIVESVRNFGANCIRTKTSHNNGTERCAEVVEHLSEPIDYIINIQGDEPMIEPQLIDSLCVEIQNRQPEIITAVRPLSREEHIQSANVVKCVQSKQGKALYFSRSVIPFKRNVASQVQYFQHIGIYGYAKQVLKEIVQLPESKLEIAEQLEQLRWLENGYTIQTIETEFPTYAVDVPEDIATIEQLLNG